MSKTVKIILEIIAAICAGRLLVYVAQAFLLVASIFGLDYYVKLITKKLGK